MEGKLNEVLKKLKYEDLKELDRMTHEDFNGNARAARRALKRSKKPKYKNKKL